MSCSISSQWLEREITYKMPNPHFHSQHCCPWPGKMLGNCLAVSTEAEHMHIPCLTPRYAPSRNVYLCPPKGMLQNVPAALFMKTSQMPINSRHINGTICSIKKNPCTIWMNLTNSFEDKMPETKNIRYVIPFS